MQIVIETAARYLLGADGGKIAFGALLGACLTAAALPPLVYNPRIADLEDKITFLAEQVVELKAELQPYRQWERRLLEDAIRGRAG
jgi:hypothetical protein